MSTLPPPVAVPTNRWAVIAVVASVVALGQIAVAALVACGIPYSWADGMRSVMLYSIAHNIAATFFTSFAVVGLILGTTAVVQCRAAKGALRGLGAAYAAVVLSLSAIALSHVVWLIGSLITIARAD